MGHGDPASHYLEAEQLYPAFASRPSQARELRLLGLLQAAERLGYPIKVALVATEDDLTDAPQMLRRPQAYADFVASELGGGLEAPVLIVTPYGLGVSGQRGPRARLRGIRVSRRADGDALAATAMVAVRRLAASDGHPLPAKVPPARLVGGVVASAPEDDSGGIDLRLAAVLFTAVLLLALVGFELWIRVPRRGDDRLADPR
jgi:2-methylcitrate dehydratase PrpD